jgi:hypothetical protein
MQLTHCRSAKIGANDPRSQVNISSSAALGLQRIVAKRADFLIGVGATNDGNKVKTDAARAY